MEDVPPFFLGGTNRSRVMTAVTIKNLNRTFVDKLQNN